MRVSGVRVTAGPLETEDLLIGMDVITIGDFSITNLNARTVFSFRFPSSHEVDYVADLKQQVFSDLRKKYKRTTRIIFRNPVTGDEQIVKVKESRQLINEGWHIVGPA